jgi:putative flippase GtrA
MYILVSCAGVGEMLSKMLATAIVFAFNYIIRKKIIYRTGDDGVSDKDVFS